MYSCVLSEQRRSWLKGNLWKVHLSFARKHYCYSEKGFLGSFWSKNSSEHHSVTSVWTEMSSTRVIDRETRLINCIISGFTSPIFLLPRLLIIVRSRVSICSLVDLFLCTAFVGYILWTSCHLWRGPLSMKPIVSFYVRNTRKSCNAGNFISIGMWLPCHGNWDQNGTQETYEILWIQ